MSYSIDVFSNWSSHSTWESLKSWLTSSEGGSLRVVDPMNKSPYAIVRYVKDKSNFSLAHVPWCRSVIVDKESRKPVCIGPPKASKFTENDLDSAVVAEEFIDGTMINIFQESSEKPIVITTRSHIGGQTQFYEGGLTFGQMLREAVEDLNSILPEAKSSETSRFVSIVLQHPNNRIVKHVEKPTFYVVHQGYANSDGTLAIEENCLINPVPKCNINAIRGAKNVESWITQQSQELGFGWQGLVLKDGSGRRWRMRSQVYETVRRIRGNEASSIERFARLRNAHTVEQYLSFYPEDHETLYTLEGELRKNTRQLLQFYKDVFRAHKVQYKQIPWPYKHHISCLHNLYKDTLKAKNQVIDLNTVIQYVNTLNTLDLANMSKKHNTELKVIQEEAMSSVTEQP
jgi:hypothetical protein